MTLPSMGLAQMAKFLNVPQGVVKKLAQNQGAFNPTTGAQALMGTSLGTHFPPGSARNLTAWLNAMQSQMVLPEHPVGGALPLILALLGSNLSKITP